MEPRKITPEIASEISFNAIDNGNNQYEVGRRPDNSNSLERLTQSPEQTKSISESSSHAALATVGSPTLPQPVSIQPQPQAPLVANDNPIIASDDDLIEKEWVDRAKQIIVQTKDDPFKREREIAQLQVDYIKKRYGRVIGEAPQES